MLEPVQGEGGIVVPPPDYLAGVRALCDEHGLLLILDEVQTGAGRTGTLFAHQRFGIEPDIMTLAKGLGSGLPIGAMLAREPGASSFGPGTHGSTFGGNALCCAGANAVLDALLEDGLIAHCEAQGEALRSRLEDLRRRHPQIVEVRGLGLLVGVVLDGPGAGVVDACLAEGLIINCTAERVLRLSPPLVVGADELDEAVEILERVLSR